MAKQPVVMITGAAGNLGRAAAEVFAEHGARLLLFDRSLEALRKAYPVDSAGRVLLAADLTNEKSVHDAVAGATIDVGPVDVLCNIAGGYAAGEPVHRMDRSVWNRLHELNAGTLLSAVKAVVPRMLTAGSGTVINIGAAGHVHGHANAGAYAASKGEVVRLTESMAEELRGSGVSVFCLMPNVIDTPQNRTSMPGADWTTWTRPRDIANLMWLLTDPTAALMSGTVLPLMGAFATPKPGA